MTAMAKTWKYRVVKRMRGMQGEYFDYPTAATFETEAEARRYAEEFARAQGAARVYGARLEVRTRKGGWMGHPGDTLVIYKSDDYLTDTTVALMTTAPEGGAPECQPPVHYVGTDEDGNRVTADDVGVQS